MALDGLRGMLTLDQLREEVENGRIDTVLLSFTDLYGRQMGKHWTPFISWRERPATTRTPAIIC